MIYKAKGRVKNTEHEHATSAKLSQQISYLFILPVSKREPHVMEIISQVVYVHE